MNAITEISKHFTEAANRQRLQVAADQHLSDNLPRPESACARDARIDDGEEEGPSDEDIIEFGVEWNLSLPELLTRLERFVVDQRELAEVMGG